MNEENKTILIIEDEKAIYMPLEILLKREGFKVKIAKDGEEAIEILGKIELIDLVLLDLVLPKINGFEIFKKIKENPKTQFTPVMIISNLGREEEIALGMALGAIKYFVKSQTTPFEIVKAVKKLLN